MCVCVCVNSHPAGEQSRRLERPYCKLVSPCVWTCTCWRAGLWLRGDAGGGVTVSARLSIRCQFVHIEVKAFSNVVHCFACIALLSSNTRACVCCRLLLVSLFLLSWLPTLASASLRSSPRVLLYSSPPPSHVGGQKNNIQGVTVTGSPLPVVFSCYCSWSYCCLAPALY